MLHPLTPAQQSALDLGSSLSVTANAGAGKTYVLARRFVGTLLEAGATLAGTVAITFTEQAAGQLRRKIHDVIVSMEGAPETAAPARLRLRDVRAQLAQAQVGTIHSFCARLLRLYPVEAGVDASFSVVEGQERERLVREAIAGALERLMKEERESSSGFRSLVRMMGPAGMQRSLHQLFRNREQMYGLQRGPEPDHAGAVDRLKSLVLERAEGMGWHGMALRAAGAARGAAASGSLEILKGRDPGLDGPGKARLLNETLRGIFTLEGKFQKKFLGKEMGEADLPPEAGRLREFHATYGPLLRALHDQRGLDAEEQFRGHLSALYGAYDTALEFYAASKEELGVLDFEDLQIRTLELLSDEAVRDRIASPYRFFLVDEFQDTNGLQYAILKRLLDGPGRGNLFIVGDPKQSIYGFRNADVSVFSKACREIPARGPDGSGGGSVVLKESFRPLPLVAAFVNHVFSRLLGSSASPFDVGYEEIVVAREDPGTGAVELTLVPGEQATGGVDPVMAECASVASRITELTAGDNGRPFGEIAVLLRDRRHLMELERALEHAEIPYVLAGGVGYFQTQEVYDFLNYLTILVDPGDDVALAGILRSPFFGLADDELFLISLAEGESLWQKLGSFRAGDPAQTGAARAHRLLSEHSDLRDRMPVSRLLRTVARETGWLGTVAGLAHGPQHRENYLKLLELARANEAKGISTVHGFVEFLGHHAETEEREGQASTATTDHAVKILTIHAAKGLEFPVVFLPFTDRESRPDAGLIVDRRYGAAFRISTAGDGKRVDPPTMQYLKLIASERRLTEEKRVFYVACTRAMDMLVISGRERTQGRAKSSVDSPLAWLEGVFGGFPGGEGPGAIDAGTAVVAVARRQGGVFVHDEIEVPLNIPVRRGDPASRGPARARRMTGEDAAPRILTGVLEDRSDGDTYSATQIRTYLECPALYCFRYVFGLEDSRRPSPMEFPVSEDGDRVEPGLEGDLTHRILSEIFTPDVDAAEVRLKAEELVVNGWGEAQRRTVANNVAGNVLSFTRSKEGREILKSPDARTEFRLSTVLRGAVVSGILDRLYRDRNGAWELVDYKTDAVDPDHLQQRALSYRPQLAVYAFLVHRHFGQASVRANLVFLRPRCRSVIFEFGPDELRNAREEIDRVIGRIRAGEFTARKPPCEACPRKGGPFCGSGSGTAGG